MSTALPFTFIILHSVEALIIILGNSLAVFVFWKHNIQRRACFFLINLAVADLLVGIAEPIVQGTGKFSKMMAEERRRGKKIMKPPAAALHLFASSASVFFLALIAMERVFAILRPLLRITSNRAYVLSAAIAWVAGLSVGGLSLLSMFTGRMNERYVEAVIRICFLLALMVIIASYTRIRRRLRSSSPEIAPTQSSKSINPNMRLSRIIFIVIASTVFWLPGFVVHVVKGFCPRCVTSRVTWFEDVLHLANSMVNPLVYAFRVPAFKDALRKVYHMRNKNLDIRKVNDFALSPAECPFTLHKDAIFTSDFPIRSRLTTLQCS